MNDYTIPFRKPVEPKPVEPVVNIKPTENGMTAEFEYTEDVLDEMVRRINKQLDEELMARLATQHGYVKERTCSDISEPSKYYFKCSECRTQLEMAEWITIYYCPNCGASVTK